MKNIIFSFAFLVMIMMNAQNKRFIYEYKLISDSTKKDEIKTADTKSKIFFIILNLKVYKIVYKNDSQRSKLLGGTISKYKNVSQVLKKMELTGAIHFKLIGHKIIVE